LFYSWPRSGTGVPSCVRVFWRVLRTRTQRHCHGCPTDRHMYGVAGPTHFRRECSARIAIVRIHMLRRRWKDQISYTSNQWRGLRRKHQLCGTRGIRRNVQKSRRTVVLWYHWIYSKVVFRAVEIRVRVRVLGRRK